MSNEIQEPAGISFFSIRSGETHYCKLEPTIAAYLNSSDMGINASRGQDYGWRLSKEWVNKVRTFRRSQTQMSILTAKNGGNKPTLVQILYYIYGEQLQQYFEVQEENENPFEEAYLRSLSEQGIDPSEASNKPALPAALEDFLAAEDDDENDDFTDIIDDVLTEDEQTVSDEAELAKMEADEKAAKVKAEKEARAKQK